MTEIIKILEIIGTIAFAVSGALVAINRELDIFGVVFVGCITAVGGGILRDMLLGIHPPAIFSNYLILFIAIITGILCFIISYLNRKKFTEFKLRIEYINNVFDAFGLAAFTVTGAEIAWTNGFMGNGFFVVLLGMITGVGGGIFRDVLIDTTPFIFKKHVYALASIIGGICYYFIRKYYGDITIGSVVAMVIIVAMRLLAAKYRWNLPKIHLGSNANKND